MRLKNSFKEINHNLKRVDFFLLLFNFRKGAPHCCSPALFTPIISISCSFFQCRNVSPRIRLCRSRFTVRKMADSLFVCGCLWDFWKNNSSLQSIIVDCIRGISSFFFLVFYYCNLTVSLLFSVFRHIRLLVFNAFFHDLNIWLSP